jgi:hypothetical protein
MQPLENTEIKVIIVEEKKDNRPALVKKKAVHDLPKYPVVYAKDTLESMKNADVS